MMLQSLGYLALCLPCVLSLGADEWAKQSIYQVLTDRFARTDGSTSASCDLNSYCGGTWQGLVKKLDYIQGMGFTAVWISPVVEQIDAPTSQDGDSYHGYWAKNFSRLNSNFGTEDDLLNLTASLHDRGMYLMLDVVTNHMAYPGCRDCVDYSTLGPFGSSSNYHSPCEIDYSDETSVQQCWEGSDNVALPDLRTEDQDVRDFFGRWIGDLVVKYGVDGLRIDSVKHQEKDFWPGFGTSAAVFSLGEVYDGDPASVPAYLDVLPGLLHYPAYYWLRRAFGSTSATVAELSSMLNALAASTARTPYLGTFVENHDQARMPAWGAESADAALVRNAIALALLMDGIPVVYQGQEQGFTGGAVPANREALWTSGYRTDADLYGWIAKLNRVRSTAVDQEASYVASQASTWEVDDHTIGLRKGGGDGGGRLVGVFTNVGSAGPGHSVGLAPADTGFGSDLALVEVLACEEATTDGSGMLEFDLGSAPKVFYPAGMLSGTGICGN